MNLTKNKEKTIEEIKKDLEEVKIRHPFDDDLLNLKDLAETISNIITNTKDPFAFSINSPYGTGKTFFLRRLHCLLENKGCNVISYNAWESDFHADPLVSLICELKNKINTKEFKDIEKEKIAVNNASLGFSYLITANFSVKKKNKLSDEYNSHKEIKENFIEALGKFTKKLNKPLVFIIDELDRCRPDYAIKTLETIKHFFNIPNIVFVLGIDRKQIESTVKVLYGSNIDSNCDEYLKKFIDQDFYLPIPSSDTYIKYLCTKYLSSVIVPFCKHNKIFCFYEYNKCLDELRAEKIFLNTLEIITEYSNALSEFFNFSLRKQEQFVIFLQMLISALSTEEDILLPEIATLYSSIRFFEHDYLKKSDILNIFIKGASVFETYPKIKEVKSKNMKYRERIDNIINIEKMRVTPLDFWIGILNGDDISENLEIPYAIRRLNIEIVKINTKKHISLVNQLNILEENKSI